MTEVYFDLRGGLEQVANMHSIATQGTVRAIGVGMRLGEQEALVMARQAELLARARTEKQKESSGFGGRLRSLWPFG